MDIDALKLQNIDKIKQINFSRREQNDIPFHSVPATWTGKETSYGTKL